jgi:2-oxoglutarate ferredoxin oxidoreductase subunit gamma
MKMDMSIIISGIGGQGVLAAGKVLSKALFRDGYEVLLTRSYGSEARGGSCRSEILISDSEINELQVQKIDVLIIMSIPAFRVYIERAKKDALVIVDEDVITEFECTKIRDDIKLISIPATKLAVILGNRIVANMVLLGALAKKLDIVSLNSLRQIISDLLRPSMHEINFNALKEGYEKA